MDVFNEGKSGEPTPDMIPGFGGAQAPSFSDYKYRVERFSLGSGDDTDEASHLEALLTRSIQPEKDVVIIERKDSISATTGVYTCIVIYLEKRLGVVTDA